MSYKDFFMMMVALIFLILTIFFLPDYSLYDYLKEIRLKSIKEKQNKGVLIVCKNCKGSGQTEQDVNLLMAEASFAIWHNIHISSNKCKVCNKDKLCEIAQKRYDETMKEYENLGPKTELATCPKCMGAGSYTQYKGYRVGTEK